MLFYQNCGVSRIKEFSGIFDCFGSKSHFEQNSSQDILCEKLIYGSTYFCNNISFESAFSWLESESTRFHCNVSKSPNTYVLFLWRKTDIFISLEFFLWIFLNDEVNLPTILRENAHWFSLKNTKYKLGFANKSHFGYAIRLRPSIYYEMSLFVIYFSTGDVIGDNKMTLEENKVQFSTLFSRSTHILL